MQSYQGETMANGVYQDSIALSPGDYTFSAYLRIGTEDADNENIGAYIRVTKADGTVLAESEHLSKYDTEFMRLIIPFALETEYIFYLTVKVRSMLMEHSWKITPMPTRTICL